MFVWIKPISHNALLQYTFLYLHHTVHSRYHFAVLLQPPACYSTLFYTCRILCSAWTSCTSAVSLCWLLNTGLCLIYTAHSMNLSLSLCIPPTGYYCTVLCLQILTTTWTCCCSAVSLCWLQDTILCLIYTSLSMNLSQSLCISFLCTITLFCACRY